MVDNNGKTSGFIVVFHAVDKVHMALPVDFIMSVAPLFYDSNIIESARTVKGRCNIVTKAGQNWPVEETFQEIIAALNAVIVSGKRPEELVTDPPKEPVIQIAAQNPVDLKKLN